MEQQIHDILNDMHLDADIESVVVQDNHAMVTLKVDPKKGPAL